MTVLATYVSINQILCPAPAKGSYLVDVSNDGVTSSGRRILHIAFDPSCYNCAVSESEEAALCTRSVEFFHHDKSHICSLALTSNMCKLNVDLINIGQHLINS